MIWNKDKVPIYFVRDKTLALEGDNANTFRQAFERYMEGKLPEEERDALC